MTTTTRTPVIHRAIRWFAPLLAIVAGTALLSVPIASAQPQQNIVQIAAGNPQFSTLVRAVQAAGLAETLSSPGPFTVFAPTNDAFGKLPAGTLDSLLQNPDQLLDVSHVQPDGRLIEHVQGLRNRGRTMFSGCCALLIPLQNEVAPCFRQLGD